ncbi:hypothetical protein LINGRAHAP2_LOCUS9331 [Linum grandiflorum]
MPTFKFVKLKDNDDDDMVVVDLKGVVEFVWLKGFYVLDGWVLLCDEHNTDVFCLVIWLEDRPIFKEYMRICKFKLDDDGSFDILTKQVVTCGPFPRYGKPFVGFTPTIIKVLNPGNSEIKLFYKESKRLEAQSYKDFLEDCDIQFKVDFPLEEEKEEEKEDEKEEEDEEEDEDDWSDDGLDLEKFLAKRKQYGS